MCPVRCLGVLLQGPDWCLVLIFQHHPPGCRAEGLERGQSDLCGPSAAVTGNASYLCALCWYYMLLLLEHLPAAVGDGWDPGHLGGVWVLGLPVQAPRVSLRALPRSRLSSVCYPAPVIGEPWAEKLQSLWFGDLFFNSVVNFLEVNMCICAKLLQSCLTLGNPMDYSPLGSSVHGILQARILEWVAMPSSRGSSQPRDQTHVS